MTPAEQSLSSPAAAASGACPLCGSTSVTPFLSTPAADVILPLRRCTACDFVFSTHRQADDERHDARYHARRELVEDAVVSTANACNMLEFWSRRLRWQAGARLLDIGCAEGRFVEVARAMGFDAHGIDITDFHVRRWREHALPAEVGSAETLLARRQPPFDIVITRQVIEHVTDPAAFLRSCASVLRPDGMCIVETGDARSVQARLQGRSWNYWVPSEGAGAHISFLTIPSARELARRAGCELVETVPMFHYRALDTYARQFGELSPSLQTRLKFFLQRHVLAGNLSYRFRRAV